MRYLTRGYFWLIGRNQCLCSLRVAWAARLCGRIDDYMLRHDQP